MYIAVLFISGVFCDDVDGIMVSMVIAIEMSGGSHSYTVSK